MYFFSPIVGITFVPVSYPSMEFCISRNAEDAASYWAIHARIVCIYIRISYLLVYTIEEVVSNGADFGFTTYLVHVFLS